MKYPDTLLLIDGNWQPGAQGAWLDVSNPASEERIGRVAKAEIADLDRALSAAERGFATWRRIPAFERSKVLRRAADHLRQRAEEIAYILTLEQGKPLVEARAEVFGGADVIDWFAAEAQRAYGRVIPARATDVAQTVIREPVGTVVTFTPWNFPITQLVRKVSAALAAGCSIIAKGPEETPGSPAALIQAFVDAGVPAGALNLIYGDPREISSHLIPHPTVRKISFTGSTPVGKELAALAGRHMKRTTMELGGHAPVIVCRDADIAIAIERLVAGKFRNAGQVCIAPTRFLVHASVYDAFVDGFALAAGAIRVGDGLSPDTQMGPLANVRRLVAMDELVSDAIDQGAILVAGGHHVGNGGHFYAPTVLKDVPLSARIMNDEPFGPVAAMAPFTNLSDAITEANRLSFGLAAYAYTRSSAVAHELGQRIESGMLSINHAGLALPETPAGGVKESGHGVEGGADAIDSYLTTKFVTHAV